MSDPTGQVVAKASCPHSGAGEDHATAWYNPYFSGADAPGPVLLRAREEQPVFYSAGDDAWFVTRFDDIREVAFDAASFSSEEFLRPAPMCAAALEVLDQGYSYEELRPLVTIDGSRHQVLRQALLPLLRRRSAELDEEIDRIADGCIDELLDTEARSADLVQAFSHPIPLLVILRLLGIPAEDRADIERWSRAKNVVHFERTSENEQVDAAREFVDFQQYVSRLLDARRASPQEDLLSDLAALADGANAEVTKGWLVGQTMGLIFAGHESTSYLLTHATYHLLANRAQWERLAEDVGLARAAVEETLRFEGSAHTSCRVATRDVEVGNTRIPRGGRVFIVLSSGSHDGARFAHPDIFDIEHDVDFGHLGFGFGQHACIGALLARKTGVSALSRLVARVPSLELDGIGVLHHRPNAHLRVPQGLPVRW